MLSKEAPDYHMANPDNPLCNIASYHTYHIQRSHPHSMGEDYTKVRVIGNHLRILPTTSLHNSYTLSTSKSRITMIRGDRVWEASMVYNTQP